MNTDDGRSAPAYLRWGIALVTLFFVAMMFAPLVKELARRLGTPSIP